MYVYTVFIYIYAYNNQNIIRYSKYQQTDMYQQHFWGSASITTTGSRVAPLHPSPWPRTRNEAGPSSIPRWNIDQGYHQMSCCRTCQHQMETKFVSKISLKLKSMLKIIDHGLQDSKRSFWLKSVLVHFDGNSKSHLLIASMNSTQLLDGLVSLSLSAL